jgi:3-dehydroquinate synthetase/3-dehydroquinate dehydratase/shikimate kinase
MQRPVVDIDPDTIAGRRIVLVGFMGAGKTTLARRWLRAGGPPLTFDSDAHALRLLGADSVTAAFDRFGEAAWRDAERAVVAARAQPPLLGWELWSLGGGAVADPDVQRALLDALVVWLDVPEEVARQRVQGSDRPLARDRARFTELFEERRETYAALASVRVDASGDEPMLPGALRSLVDPSAFDGDVVVQRGLVSRLGDLSCLTREAVVVVDAALAARAGDVVAGLEAAGSRVLDTHVLPMGEWNKQLGTVESLLSRWSDVGVHRDTLVVAVGGGTLLDTVGFAASAYQRGVRWVSVPSTLVAQVDAGIGGKTGVNLGVRKNVVGAVHFPECVAIDPDLLDTLPAEALRDGAVEALKTGLLAGPWLLDRVREAVLDDGRPAGARWAEAVAGCAAFKSAVVAEDPDDRTGVRAQLNLGHTLAHALESATVNAVSHGAAVAVGMRAALELSVAEVELARTVVDDVEALARAGGIALTSPVPFAELEPFLAHDKKRSSGGIGWVLLAAPGEPVTEVPLAIADVAAVWERVVLDTAAADDAAPAQGSRAGAHARPRVLALFGINLGELGLRDASHYGSGTLADLVASIGGWGSELGLDVECRQTDSLERFDDALRAVRAGAFDAVLVNPGAWTHHERALHDAIESIAAPVVEVHLTDIAAREEWRTVSVIAPVVDHAVSGEGPEGYRTALTWVAQQLAGGPL